MTTTIRATCGDCGDVKLRDYEVTLRICTDNNEGSYRFRCPKCNKYILKSATPLVVNLLKDTEVHTETWSLPIEFTDARPDRGPITQGDILTLHQLLESDGEI